MNISNKTILITGGGSGIGLQTALLLSHKGNNVIITGRNTDKLQKAVAGLKNVTAITSDITSPADVDQLVTRVKAEFGNLSILINNAATLFLYNHGENVNAFEKAQDEILTNYLSVIRLNEKFLPLLKAQPEAAIVNVTSAVALIPVGVIPSYSDSKAALHSYTISLRRELAKTTAIKVFELMPPLVNTDFAKELGGATHGMPAIDVAQALINGIENNDNEIYAGATKELRALHFSNQEEALNVLNQ